jgi:hypothetical protein
MPQQHMNNQRSAPRVVIEVDDRTAPRPQEMLARAVAVIGGTCLVIGGVVGYAIGFLEGLGQKKDDHAV